MQFQIISLSKVSGTGWLVHDGVSKLDGAPGRGSGRYPLGSGARPFRHQVEGTSSAEKKETVKDAKENLNKKQNGTLRQRLFKKQSKDGGYNNVAKMTDEELRKAKDRNNLEKDYIESKTNLIKANSTYNSLTKKPDLLASGKKLAGEVLHGAVKVVATKALIEIGNKYVAKTIAETNKKN